jgi:Ni,Fe-hydrogenase III small subunit
LFLQNHGEQLRKNSPDKNIIIAIGKGHTDLPFGTLCIGNCTAKHKDCGIFVPGCPPVASEILREYFK